MKCVLCGQENVDGAIDQFGDFVCVDCWALGEAQYVGCKAKILAPVPGYDYSSLNHQKILDAYNRKNKK
jgi:hypothetical protein